MLVCPPLGFVISPYKPLQNVYFERSVTCSFFVRNCSHILTRTQGKNFEDMFLVKIASKGTSLRWEIVSLKSCHFPAFIFSDHDLFSLIELISFIDPLHQKTAKA